MLTPPYAKAVFINCPFDEAYKPLFEAIVFTIYRCGFTPRSAAEADDATVNRIDKIIRIIAECKYGVHDISRVEVNLNGFPRFNMPFEYGLFLGAKKYGIGRQKDKVGLILEGEQHSSKEYLSDIGGADPQAHFNKEDQIIKIIRNWLHTASKRKIVPSFQTINDDYAEFKTAIFPVMLKENNTTFEHLTFNDYCQFVEIALKAKLDQK